MSDIEYSHSDEYEMEQYSNSDVNGAHPYLYEPLEAEEVFTEQNTEAIEDRERLQNTNW